MKTNTLNIEEIKREALKNPKVQSIIEAKMKSAKGLLQKIDLGSLKEKK